MIDIVDDNHNARREFNIIVVSPMQIYIDAFKKLIRSPIFRVVGGGRSLDEALSDEAIPKGPDKTFDLIIYNFSSGAETEREIAGIQAARKRFPRTKFIILADCDDINIKFQAIQAGVEGFLSRNISLDVLNCSIELVLLGEHIVPTALAQRLLGSSTSDSWASASEARTDQHPSRTAAQAGPPTGPATLLSDREHQILRCLVDGLTNKAIAREFDIAEATVKVHVKALLRKTRMANRTQAAIWALNQASDGKPSATDDRAVQSASQRWLKAAQGALTDPGATSAMAPKQFSTSVHGDDAAVPACAAKA